MAKLYSDNIKEQIDDLFAPSVKPEEPAPEPPTLVVEEKEREPVKFDGNIGDMLYDLFETTEVVLPEVEILEVAEPIAEEKPAPRPRTQPKPSLKEENNINYVEQMASKMAKVQKRTSQAAGQERLTEEQLTLNNFQIQLDGIRRALREHTVVSGIGQGGDGQTPGSGVVRIRDLDDVDLDNISSGDSLIWDDLLGSFVPGAGGTGGGAGVSRIQAGEGIEIDPAGGIGVVEISAKLELTDLDDVIGTADAGDFLIYDGSKWASTPLDTSNLNLNSPQGNPFNAARYSRYEIVADGSYNTQQDANILFVDLINDLDARIEELEPDPTDPDASSIGDLDDVSLAGAKTGDFLVYDGDTSMWNAATVPIPNIVVDSDEPNTGSEQQGDLWYNTDTGELHIYDNIWTVVSTSGGASVELGNNPPIGTPVKGNLWVDTTTWSLYVYDGFNWVGLTNEGLTGSGELGEDPILAENIDGDYGSYESSLEGFKEELRAAVNDSTDYESLKSALITALS